MTGMLALPVRGWAAQQSTITIGAPGFEGVTVPEDFLGLSYETPQLYNSAFFAPGNGALIDAFRGIAPHGVLRFGGSLSAYSRWRRPGVDFGSVKEEAAIAAQGNWEWKLLDPPLARPFAGAITPKTLWALRGFLDATGWQCIYGLNFGSGTIVRAVDEADHVHRILGQRLLCFQLGNEADFWAGNPLLRSKDYSLDIYWDEYRSFVRAIRARVPNAPFAGPDVAINLEWLARFAELARGDALFCSAHYYGMGPASDPRMDARKLLTNGNDKLAQEMAAVKQIATRTGMRFRMTEGNSCFGGGKAGVSDAFASALWGYDYALQTASAGYLGINLHGGGEGLYTPIASSPSGQELRPAALRHGVVRAVPGQAPTSLPDRRSAECDRLSGRKRRNAAAGDRQQVRHASCDPARRHAGPLDHAEFRTPAFGACIRRQGAYPDRTDRAEQRVPADGSALFGAYAALGPTGLISPTAAAQAAANISGGKAISASAPLSILRRNAPASGMMRSA